MDKKIKLKQLKNSMVSYIMTETKTDYGTGRNVKYILKAYKELNEKDKELEDLIDFYYIMSTDHIDNDIIINNYKVLLPCCNIYKLGSIKAVNDYLRSIPSNIREQNNPVITNTKEQSDVNTENQSSNTTTNDTSINISDNFNTIFSKLNSNIPLDEKDKQFLNNLELLDIPDAEIFDKITKSVLADTKDFLELTDSEIVNYFNNNTIGYNIAFTILKSVDSKTIIYALLNKDDLFNNVDKNKLSDEKYLLELFDKLPMNMQEAVYKIINRVANMETYGKDNNVRKFINEARQLKAALTPKEKVYDVEYEEVGNNDTNNEEQQTVIVEEENNKETNDDTKQSKEVNTKNNKSNANNTKQPKKEKVTNAIIDCIKGHENFPFVETGYFSADGIEYKNLITKKVVTYTKEEFANFKIQYLNDPLIQFRNTINDNLKSLNPCDYLMMKGYQITLNNFRTFMVDGYLYCVNNLNNSSFCLYKDMMNIILNNGAIYIIYFDKCSVNDLYNLVEQYWNTGTIEPRLFAKLIKSKALVPYNTTTK